MEFYIVQSVETISGNNETFFSVMPSQWIIPGGWNNGEEDSDSEEFGDDLMYWPHRNAYDLLLAGEKNPFIIPDPELCDTYRCIIKMKGFRTKKEATRRMKIMEEELDTQPEYPRAKKRKSQETRDDLFEAACDINHLPSISEVKSESNVTINANNWEFNNGIGTTEFETGDRPITNTIKIIDKDEFRHQIVMNKLNSIEKQLQTFQQSVLNEITKLNAKLDLIGSSSVATDQCINAHIPEINVRIVEDELQPVCNLEELVQLNERAKNPEYIMHCIRSLRIGSNNQNGNGWNTALRTVDTFFDREFLTHCTWTGVSRQPGSTKYCLSEYKFVIKLFEDVIFYSDNCWTSDQNLAFLKSILNNSHARYKRDKRLRMPTARPSRIKKQSKLRVSPRSSNRIVENVSGNVENVSGNVENVSGSVENVSDIIEGASGEAIS